PYTTLFRSLRVPPLILQGAGNRVSSQKRNKRTQLGGKKQRGQESIKSTPIPLLCPPPHGLRSTSGPRARRCADRGAIPEGYRLLPSVRGDLRAKLGRSDEARAECERSNSLTRNAID